MIPRSRLLHIQGLARQVLIDKDRMRLPVDPKGLARQLDIVVEPLSLPASDISGCLMRVGNGFGIGYSAAIRNEGFQNFTVAHELGHYFIDDHPFAILGDGKHFSRSGYISKDRFEQEADGFATELLMPWKLIEPIIRARKGGFEVIKAISDNCKSSIVASAIRYAQVTRECVAVIVSHLGNVEFMTASDSFKGIHGLDWLRRRDSLPPAVPSKRLSADLEWIRSGAIAEEGGYLACWFPGVRDREVEEDVVGLGSYERLLTILMTEETALDEDETDEEEDDYIGRWQKGVFRAKK